MLNYHHLQYFWAVAHDGNLTRTANRLRIAPSALSTQIRQLEDQVGEALFTRERRRLVLTEAGALALAYADDIFAAGGELEATLKSGRGQAHELRVGAVATLSRNFQRSFLHPLLAHPDVRLRITAGSFDELLAQLGQHALDIVLANRPAPRSPEQRFRTRRLARQAVSIVSSRPFPGFVFPASLASRAMIVPGMGSDLRAEFDALCERTGARVRILAEVDDMATIRLLARDSEAFVLVPSVVVREELRLGTIHELCVVPHVTETFYAVTAERRFQHPLLRSLLARDEAHLLDALDAREASSGAPGADAERRGSARGRRGDGPARKRGARATRT